MSAKSVIIYGNMHYTSNLIQQEHNSEKGEIIIMK